MDIGVAQKEAFSHIPVIHLILLLLAGLHLPNDRISNQSRVLNPLEFFVLVSVEHIDPGLCKSLTFEGELPLAGGLLLLLVLLYDFLF